MASFLCERLNRERECSTTTLYAAVLRDYLGTSLVRAAVALLSSRDACANKEHAEG